jgi:hypothetical protein
MFWGADARFGSKPEVGARNREVGFTPLNGHRQLGTHVGKVPKTVLARMREIRSIPTEKGLGFG